ncbi:MAG: hypothetical protein AB8F65_13585 [Woeseiaceae bacterium]
MRFLHTITGLGMLGGLVAYIMVLMVAPDITSIDEHLALRTSLSFVSNWLILPSMLLVLVTGLLAMALNNVYMSAPWVWAKALSGVLVFEATLASIDAPADRALIAVQKAAAGTLDAQELSTLVHDEFVAWWILVGLGVANTAVGVWRPKFGQKRRRD